MLGKPQISVDTFTGDWAEVGKSVAVDVDELVFGGWNDGHDILARDVVSCCHCLCDLVIEEVDDCARNQVMPVFLDDDLPSRVERRENKKKKDVLPVSHCHCVRMLLFHGISLELSELVPGS